MGLSTPHSAVGLLPWILHSDVSLSSSKFTMEKNTFTCWQIFYQLPASFRYLSWTVHTNFPCPLDLTRKHVDVIFKFPVAPSPRAWLRESLEAGQGLWDQQDIQIPQLFQKCCSFLIIVIMAPALPERVLIKQIGPKSHCCLWPGPFPKTWAAVLHQVSQHFCPQTSYISSPVDTHYSYVHRAL